MFILYLTLPQVSLFKQNLREREFIAAAPVTLLETVHKEDLSYLKENFELFRSEPSKMCLSFHFKCPQSQTYWIRLSVFPLEQANATDLIAGIAEDVSSRKKNYFSMQKINARKNSMLEILSHDLRGPIGIVHSLAALVEEELPATATADTRKQLQIIQQICMRNIDLIRDLVRQEFLESAQVEMDRARVDLVWEINEVIENYRNAQDNISKTFELTSSQKRLYIKIDSTKFMQVINNLISNSIKFTHEDGRIRVNIEEKSDKVLISVSDKGIGIPEKLQPFLFEKFIKARRHGLKGEEPVGLGMSIIKTVVEMHDGKIWFESKERAGTTFFIELPNME